ncbi:Uncharacterised protein [Neisseria gonorrhoeae]|uniref:Uncharacterized protein n=1 Tax=Neisseria gonorrhoeae TaxID=485 RepID=A0A378VZ52_NEIGO|nr:Uncharacterised protein [Neisseria gonorrhoeae]
MRILDKWFLEDASVRTKLTMELTLPLAWKDLDYDEFQLAVSQMATDWLEQRICELENDLQKSFMILIQCFNIKMSATYCLDRANTVVLGFCKI